MMSHVRSMDPLGRGPTAPPSHSADPSFRHQALIAPDGNGPMFPDAAFGVPNQVQPRQQLQPPNIASNGHDVRPPTTSHHSQPQSTRSAPGMRPRSPPRYYDGAAIPPSPMEIYMASSANVGGSYDNRQPTHYASRGENEPYQGSSSARYRSDGPRLHTHDRSFPQYHHPINEVGREERDMPPRPRQYESYPSYPSGHHPCHHSQRSAPHEHCCPKHTQPGNERWSEHHRISEGSHHSYPGRYPDSVPPRASSEPHPTHHRGYHDDRERNRLARSEDDVRHYSCNCNNCNHQHVPRDSMYRSDRQQCGNIRDFRDDKRIGRPADDKRYASSPMFTHEGVYGDGHHRHFEERARGYDSRRNSNQDERIHCHQREDILSPLSVPTCINDPAECFCPHCAGRNDVSPQNTEAACSGSYVENRPPPPAGKNYHNNIGGYDLKGRYGHHPHSKSNGYQAKDSRYYRGQQYHSTIDDSGWGNCIPSQVVCPNERRSPMDSNHNSSAPPPPPPPERRDDYSGSSTLQTPSTYAPSPTPQGQWEGPPTPPSNCCPRLSVEVPASPYAPIDSNTRPPTHSGRSGRGTNTYSKPYQTSEVNSQYAKTPRVIQAENEQRQSQARHQIMKEIAQATNMKKSALNDRDRKFWERQIETLNGSFQRL